ncbi:hypothetical protein ACTHTH_11420, partial [Neisseria sp. P0017.S008]|uniref:hypothetical protein n=1 Tax=Neisseria sp. P0017.S008 TaxID=3436784 RepID=UPI003F80E84D
PTPAQFQHASPPLKAKTMKLLATNRDDTLQRNAANNEIDVGNDGRDILYGNDAEDIMREQTQTYYGNEPASDEKLYGA